MCLSVELCDVHQIAPKYLLNSFLCVNNAHNIHTRSSQASLVPRHRSLLGKSSFKYTGANEWKILRNFLNVIF